MKKVTLFLEPSLNFMWKNGNGPAILSATRCFGDVVSFVHCDAHLPQDCTYSNYLHSWKTTSENREKVLRAIAAHTHRMKAEIMPSEEKGVRLSVEFFRQGERSSFARLVTHVATSGEVEWTEIWS